MATKRDALPDAKKPRTSAGPQLVALHRESYLSQRALTAVLRQVRDHGLPSAISRSSQARALHDAATVDTSCGKLVIELEWPSRPGPETYAIQNPLAMLWYCARRCAPFRAFLRDTLRRHPCTIEAPWHIILYWDGVSPQDPLARGADKRKIQCVYWTFKEFAPLLWDELLWFEVAATRDYYVYKLPGKVSQYLSMVLESAFFSSDNSFDRHGAMLDLSDTGDASDIQTIWAIHAVTITDFKALEEALGAKGPQGTRPCPICRNILSHRYGDAEMSGGRFLTLTCVDTERWQTHTDETIRLTVLGLRDAHTQFENRVISKTEFEARQQRAGYKFLPNTLILNERVAYKAATTTFMEWMHTLCQDGVFQRDLNALLHVVHEAKARGAEAVVTPTILHDYMLRWTLPKQLASAADVFETGGFQASSSATLSAAPVLAHFFRHVFPTGLHSAAVASFLQCCQVLEMVAAAAKGDVVLDALLPAVREYFVSHLAAHGEEFI